MFLLGFYKEIVTFIQYFNYFLGYSTHVLGVKSNCKLEYLSKIAFPSFVVEVIPLLPILQVNLFLDKLIIQN